MHDMKRYWTTLKQTNEGYTAHNAQNVAHYHCSSLCSFCSCSSTGLATLLDFPNHRFFLAAKLHKASQIWCFCPAIRLVAFVVSFTASFTA